MWAPDVKSVRVIGDFNDWDTDATYLECTPTGGVWYGFVPGATEGQLYKYLIETAHGDLLYKADPYAFYAECPPGTASRTADISGYAWQDEKYMASRAKQDFFKRPLNIFECHLGSWKRHPDGLWPETATRIPTTTPAATSPTTSCPRSLSTTSRPWATRTSRSCP